MYTSSSEQSRKSRSTSRANRIHIRANSKEKIPCGNNASRRRNVDRGTKIASCPFFACPIFLSFFSPSSSPSLSLSLLFLRILTNTFSSSILLPFCIILATPYTQQRSHTTPQLSSWTPLQRSIRKNLLLIVLAFKFTIPNIHTLANCANAHLLPHKVI